MCIPRGETIRIDGIVQGVGFRPFVRKLAVEHGLTGDVCNTSQGVVIRAFGPADRLAAFRAALETSPPALAVIETIDVAPCPAPAPAAFAIRPSAGQSTRTVSVTPDAATCADCVRELFDPGDRRYRYPFINCTQCGPRYSIIEDVPYDRPHTTMRDFAMCSDCRREYEDPESRRYHAQPNCCPVCGPCLRLLDGAGRAVAGDAVAQAVAHLKAGQVAAIKGLGGYHLACNADDTRAVERLRARKHREGKPLAVMVPDLAAAQALVELTPEAAALLAGPICPVVIAPWREGQSLSPAVAPVGRCCGVFLPYTPLHHLLFAAGLAVLVMTSANRTDEPIVISNDEALERLEGIADVFLVHDRRINVRVDDSVVLAADPEPIVVRRARGYVPAGIGVNVDVDGIAGFGPFFKNTMALGRGQTVYLGQHVGDMENVLTETMFHEIQGHLEGILGLAVRHVACDLHPDFPTTRLAEQTGLPLTRVQHHHAHLVAAMATSRCYERALGVSLDGSGFGADGAVWGGEFMAFDPGGCDRLCHLEYVALPGGDQAARQPWRMALAHLRAAGLDWERWIRHPQAPAVAALLDSDMPQSRTSSMGRLFDAVASLCGLCQENRYEGEAAMTLEGVAEDDGGHYPFAVAAETVSVAPLFTALLADLEGGVPVARVAGRFHNTVVELVLAVVARWRERLGLQRVCLAGGCFMNRWLHERLVARLQAAGLEVVVARRVPPNDGGVSLGQVVVAAWQRGGG